MHETRAIRWAALGAVASIPLVLTACVGQPGEGNAAITTVPSPSSSVVGVQDVSGYGRVLVTSSGRSLYMLSADPAMTSSCTGYCVQAWPPVLVKGPVKAGPGAEAKLLATSQRSGGEEQVFYAKHALYTYIHYIHDSRPGMTTGEGIKSYGGTWWLISPDGTPIKQPSR